LASGVLRITEFADGDCGAVHAERMRGQRDNGDVAGLRIALEPPRTPPPERKVSLADELDFWKRDHAQNLSEHDAAQKRRPKHEAILVITCLLAVSYTYPVETFDKNPAIEISAISLKIPLLQFFLQSLPLST
jgi:hypothetical protein